ncbi:MAG: DUF3343 domain-containing protein [Candidatus Cloacimonetes bacterium]|nr:DUF3343 domain-containing protein [Candidatus Cloacimonadota bacterium]
MSRFVITFGSTHQAMAAEHSLDGVLPLELIPTPREISSECGFTLLVKVSTPNEITGILHKKKLPFSAIYKVNEYSGGKSYEIVY